MLSICIFIFLVLMSFFSWQILKSDGKPLIISLLFWACLFIVFAVTPVKYYPLTSEASLFLIGTFACFVCGYWIAILSLRQVFRSNAGSPDIFLSYNKVLFMTVFFASIVIVALYSQFSFMASGEGLQDSLSSIREATLSGDIAKPMIVRLVDLLAIPFLFLGVMLVFLQGKKWKVQAFIILSSILLFQILSMSRGYIVYLFFLLIVVFFIAVDHNKSGETSRHAKKTLYKMVILLLIIFQIFAVIRTREGSESIISYLEETMTLEEWAKPAVKEVPESLVYIQILHYLTSGIAGFSAYTQNGLPESEYFLGTHSFHGVVKLVDTLRANRLSSREAFNYNYQTIYDPTTTNVYTFFREHLDDFGILGTCLLHFFWGWLLALSYLIYMRKRSVFLLVFPVSLTSWYMYGAFIMQTVFTNAVLWPVLAAGLMLFLMRVKKVMIWEAN